MNVSPCHLLTTCLFTALLSTATAAEYFVAAQGNDGNDGSDPARAFRTIQKGVDSLLPGDTLTIAPGEYHEAVRRAGLGGTNAVTTIRAEIPGTVLLRGDLPVEGFRKVEGYRFVYVTDFVQDQPVPAVIEQDTLHVLPGQPNVTQLEMVPGSFFHDLAAGKLYLSATRLAAVPEHRYTATVISTHGLYLSNARGVVIEGLDASGFHSSEILHHAQGTLGSVWGIFLNDSSGCTVRNCRAWFNGGGIGLNSGDSAAGDNVIEHCTTWVNINHNSPEDLGGVTIFAGRRDTIRHCTAFMNGKYGINIYGTGTDGGAYGEWQVPGNEPENRSRIINCLAWDNYCDFKIKTGVKYFHTIERCIGPGLWSVTPGNVTRSLIGRSTREFGRDNIVLSQETNLNLHAEFVDPDRHDYRLRAGSRFRGTGPGGSDRGPYPYEPVVESALRADPARAESAPSSDVGSGAGFQSGSPADRVLPSTLHAPPAHKPHIVGPFVHSTSPTTADLEWWVSAPGAYLVNWGEGSERTNSFRLDSATFGSFSLTGLQPGRHYSFSIGSNGPLPDTAGATVTVATVSFETTAQWEPPRTLYVATHGNNDHSGLSREQAWRTVQHAADRVRPGDTLLIAGGTYSESVRVRATGAKERPITFKALPGEKVNFDGLGRNLAFTFVAAHKSYLHFDGFYFAGFALVTDDAPWSHRWPSLNGAIDLYRCRDISVTRCFMDGRGPGYSPGLVMAMHSANVTFRNNVTIHAMGQGVTIYWDSPGARVENNVFLVSLITQTGIQIDRRFLLTPSDTPCLTRNIITDNLAKKAPVPLLYNNDVVQTRENCFFLRVPPEQRVWSGNGQSVADFLRRTSEDGSDLGNIAADPRFAGDPGVEPDPRPWAGYSPDHMLRRDFPLDFDFLFATNPEVVQRGIGLDPKAFADFHFNRGEPTDRPRPSDVARITVSHNQPHLPRMVDENPASTWSTGACQENGMWIAMRFAQPREISSMTLDWGRNYPGACVFHLQRTPAEDHSTPLPLIGKEGLSTINLPAGQPVTGIRIVVTEPRTNQWWGLRGLKINGRTPVLF